jgi:hypothetical protein
LTYGVAAACTIDYMRDFEIDTPSNDIMFSETVSLPPELFSLASFTSRADSLESPREAWDSDDDGDSLSSNFDGSESVGRCGR